MRLISLIRLEEGVQGNRSRGRLFGPWANTVCLKRFTIYEHEQKIGRLAPAWPEWPVLAKGSAWPGLGNSLACGSQKATRKVRTNYEEKLEEPEPEREPETEPERETETEPGMSLCCSAGPDVLDSS